MINGNKPDPANDDADPTAQVIKAGAVVELHDGVLLYGVLFHHPELPPFKLHLELDMENKKITKYGFELVERERPEVQRYVVDLLTAVPKSSILMPGDEGFEPQ